MNFQYGPNHICYWVSIIYMPNNCAIFDYDFQCYIAVILGIVIFVVTSCLLLLVLVVSVRSYVSYKKQGRGEYSHFRIYAWLHNFLRFTANSVAITEMSDAYGVFNHKVVMNTNPAYEDFQLYRHE